MDNPVEPTAAIASPGMLSSHYAPDSRLRLDATHLAPGEALLAFGPAPLEGIGRWGGSRGTAGVRAGV